MKSNRRSTGGPRGAGGAVLAGALAMALVALAPSAHATDRSEGAILGLPATPFSPTFPYNPSVDTPSEAADFSSVGTAPTDVGALTLGANHLTGATYPYGNFVEAIHGYDHQDNDFITFKVPTGDLLTGLTLDSGSSINPGDQLFMGIAKGGSIDITPPYASGASGLLGYTLVSSAAITDHSNILTALGESSPPGFVGLGATTFSGPLGAGQYTLWLLDGDNPVTYNVDLQVEAAPEPGAWVMLLAGTALLGGALRLGRKRRRAEAPLEARCA